MFGLGALLFLFVTLGIGVLISSVSQNQGQAIQLAVMTLLPQVLLSGLIFPLTSIAAGVRWISYLLPLTYFNEISRGVMLRAEPIGALWQPFVFLGPARRRGRDRRDAAVPRLPRAGRPASAARGAGRPPGRREPGAVTSQDGRERRPAALDGAGTAAAGAAREVRVAYGKTVALDGVTLSAPAGQVTAVVGGDGAGKTHAAALPGRGAGARQRARSRARRQERIGYLPASSGIYPDLTVAENLDFRAAGYGMSRAAVARARAAEYLDRAGPDAAARTGSPGSCPAGCGRSSA